jgi:hypothetical protein
VTLELHRLFAAEKVASATKALKRYAASAKD